MAPLLKFHILIVPQTQEVINLRLDESSVADVMRLDPCAC